MAKRKTRKERYLASVQGKIGGLDVVNVKRDADYLINKQGAKVYTDVMKNPLLPIPTIQNTDESGVIHEVLSIGYVHNAPIATIKSGDLAQAYRLPVDYNGWAQMLVSQSMAGIKRLPARIEFGKHADSGEYYAEIL